MELVVPFQNAGIHVRTLGAEGPALVLLHGYLEHSDIWNGFADMLAEKHRVILMDIPGHGRSGTVAPVHSMDLMSEAVRIVLDKLDINRCIIAGHSMGGYVALACLANFPNRISGLCLLHSTPFADTEEKKKNRDREITLIREGKLCTICSVNIPNGFATDHLGRMQKEVERAIQIACESPAEGTISLLEGLKSRPDRLALFQSTQTPMLVVLGRKDNYIPYQTFLPVAQSAPNGRTFTLAHSGHCGFIEEPETTAKELIQWAQFLQ